MLPALQAGGVERGTLEISRFLVEQGHRSLVMSGDGRMVAQLEAEGGEHFKWPIGKKSLFSLRLVRPLRRFFECQKVDIIHVRSRVPAWLAWLAWRNMDPDTRPHLVTTAHGLYSVSKWSAIMTQGERVIAVSDTVADYLRKEYPLDPQRIRVIHRGVDPNSWPHGYQPGSAWLDSWQRKYPGLTGQMLITLPGRITRWKGQLAFVRLIRQLRDLDLPVHGLLVGDTDPHKRRYEQEIRNQIHDLGLEQHITLTGHRSDIREIMSISTLVLSLSLEPEAFGRTVPEALALGKPVAGFAHGGVGEVLQRWYPSGMVRPCDETHLLQVVRQLLQQPAPIPEQPLFTLRHMQQATLNVYRELVP